VRNHSADVIAPTLVRRRFQIHPLIRGDRLAASTQAIKPRECSIVARAANAISFNSHAVANACLCLVQVTAQACRTISSSSGEFQVRRVISVEPYKQHTGALGEGKAQLDASHVRDQHQQAGSPIAPWSPTSPLGRTSDPFAAHQFRWLGLGGLWRRMAVDAQGL
jgi:hypothetical protein